MKKLYLALLLVLLSAGFVFGEGLQIHQSSNRIAVGLNTAHREDTTGADHSAIPAANVDITDVGVIITATEVEAALQENRTAINLNTAKVTNVDTDITVVEAPTNVDIQSSDGTNDTIAAADGTNAGVMTKVMYDQHVANNAKVSNVTTNLSEGTSTETTVNVNSSDGSNATLASASTSRAGVLTKAKFDEIVANTSAKHTQGTDTALGTLGTKATPIDADLVIQRDSAASFAVKTSTWTQVKAFLKTYFDTLYSTLTHAARHTNGNDDIQNATTSQKGLLTNTDWNTFNGKSDIITTQYTKGSTLAAAGTWADAFTLAQGTSVIVDIRTTGDSHGSWIGLITFYDSADLAVVELLDGGFSFALTVTIASTGNVSVTNDSGNDCSNVFVNVLRLR